MQSCVVADVQFRNYLLRRLISAQEVTIAGKITRAGNGSAETFERRPTGFKQRLLQFKNFAGLLQAGKGLT